MASTAQQIEFIIAGVLKADGSINSAGTVEFFAADGAYTTTKDAYTAAAKTGNITTKTLDSTGKATVYCDGTYDIRIKDSDGNVVDTLPNMFFNVNTSASDVFSIRTVTATTATLSSADNMLIINRNGNCAVTMSAMIAGKRFTVKNIHASAGTTTLTRVGADVFDSAATSITIVGTNALAEIIGDTDNSVWHVVVPRIHTHADAANGGAVLNPTSIDTTNFDVGSSLGSDITVIKDEDDQQSDSAVALLTQQSAKAYTDKAGQVRAKFTYNGGATAFTYKVGSARYWHVGTRSQWVYWDAELTPAALAAPGANVWGYLYIDDSAVVTADTNLLTATELLWSTTAPTYSNAKGGWYNGDDKCVFMAPSNAANNNFKIQWHEGGNLMQHDGSIEIRAAAELDGVAGSGWETVTATVGAPLLDDIRIQCGVRLYYSNGSGQLWVRHGSSSGTGIFVCAEAGVGDIAGTVFDILANVNAGALEFSAENSFAGAADDDMGAQIWANGWYFPRGM